MIVKPDTFKKLSAINEKNKLVDIPNIVLRKITPVKNQGKNLTKNSICIVCNFRFLENKAEWSKKIKAICHPFRDDSIFPDNVKKYLFSESDFCDKLISPTKYKLPEYDKYDFVYFTLNSREGTRSKGIYTLSLLNEVAGILKLKGLVVNYATRETAKHKGTIYAEASNLVKKQIHRFKNLKVTNNFFRSGYVCGIMNAVKFVYLPSDADASPRLLTESLIRDKPLVINSAIYGGWKYINSENGAFFEAPTIREFVKNKYKKDYLESLKQSIEKVLSIDNSKISKEFYKEYGFLNSSKRLAKIVNNISGTKYKAVAYREWGKHLKKAFLGK